MQARIPTSNQRREDERRVGQRVHAVADQLGAARQEPVARIEALEVLLPNVRSFAESGTGSIQ